MGRINLSPILPTDMVTSFLMEIQKPFNVIQGIYENSICIFLIRAMCVMKKNMMMIKTFLKLTLPPTIAGFSFIRLLVDWAHRTNHIFPNNTSSTNNQTPCKCLISFNIFISNLNDVIDGCFLSVLLDKSASISLRLQFTKINK